LQFAALWYNLKKLPLPVPLLPLVATF